MKPIQCENCCGKEFIEEADAYVCAYCDSRFPRREMNLGTFCNENYQNFREKVDTPSYSKPTPETRTEAPVTTPKGKQKSKWVSFALCFFLGIFGAHKFYEGKIGMGLLYLFTGGLFYFGWLVDLIVLLCKPNPYYVK